MTILYVLCFILTVSAVTTKAQSNATVDIVDVLIKEKTHLKAILLEEHKKVNKIIFEMFPDLEKKFVSIKKDIYQCYDESVTKNEKVDIFKTKMKTVLKKFFHSYDFLLKNLTRKEIQKRVKIVTKNIKQLAEMIIDCVHDRRKGKPTNKLGVTPMAFYSTDEVFDKIFNHELNKNSSEVKLAAYVPGSGNDPCNPNPLPSDKPTPAKFSWKDLGFVSPVVWQGDCKACYALAAVGAFESQYMLRSNTQNPIKFSVQKVINCVGKGCQGGRMDEVDRHFMQVGASLDAYAPYIKVTDKCRPLPPALYAQHACSHSWLSIEQIERLVYRNGPASVAFDGNTQAFLRLKNAPFSSKCGSKLNHALVLVGWDQKYWILKNSWSKEWGTRGYFYLPKVEKDQDGRMNDNKCGVRQMFSQAVYGV